MSEATGAKLEFGLFSHIEKTGGSPALDALYNEHIRFIQEAERAGFWGYHLAEHHATSLSMVPSPGLFLAALARKTKRIRIGPDSLPAAVLQSAAADL